MYQLFLAAKKRDVTAVRLAILGSLRSYYGDAKDYVWRGILDKIVIRSCPVRHYIVLHGHVPGDTISYPRYCSIVMAMPVCSEYVVPHAAISYPIMLYRNLCGVIL